MSKLSSETLDRIRQVAAHSSDSGLAFPDQDDLLELLTAYDSLLQLTLLRSIDDNPPIDRPILAWCDHEADPYIDPDNPKRLTLYGGHAEGMSHAPTGWHIVEWGGAWNDSSHEYDGGWMPDWWFVAGSEFECAANPLFWIPLPEQPIYERKILNQEGEDND